MVTGDGVYECKRDIITRRGGGGIFRENGFPAHTNISHRINIKFNVSFRHIRRAHYTIQYELFYLPGGRKNKHVQKNE